MYITKRNKNVCPQENLSTNIYSSVIHNNLKWKRSKCQSIDEWITKMDNQYWLLDNQYSYKGILLNHTKDTCYDMDEH